MKLAILGYGKMGKEIEKVALERGHSINVIIQDEESWKNQQDGLKHCDAAIEFSMPEAAPQNLLRCFEYRLPVVTGTTGWYARLEEIKSRCIAQQAALFYASNFSVGVNIFFEINRKLASLMNARADYEVQLEEIHHRHKLDAPSGTAVTLANDIISRYPLKNEWINSNQALKNQVGIQSLREGEVPGIHQVEWSSDIDRITIRHEAFSRKGFAVGAILAAEFIREKKGIYTMSDLLNI